jgi:hypothetical protein
MPETCPSCGAEATGRYCNACGAALSAACRDCGNPLPRGARFCNECGATAAPHPAAAAPAGGHRLPWAIAAAASLLLVVSLLWPGRTADDPVPSTPVEGAATFTGPTGGPPAEGAPDISQMTPRQRAEALFNRVMRAVTSGDTAQAVQFVPMAVAAYGMLPERTSDDHYHLAALHIVAGDPASARAQADTVLASHPTHLLALFTAAQAEQTRDAQPEARRLLERFLAAYPAESVRRDVPEYQDHAQALPVMREAAQRLVSGGS